VHEKCDIPLKLRCVRNDLAALLNLDPSGAYSTFPAIYEPISGLKDPGEKKSRKGRVER